MGRTRVARGRRHGVKTCDPSGSFSLVGKNAVITGSGSGLGLAVAARIEVLRLEDSMLEGAG
jgi:hypothetical protein